jgi:type II secretion system protein I
LKTLRISVAPSGLAISRNPQPGAYAPGYTTSPLRGERKRLRRFSNSASSRIFRAADSNSGFTLLEIILALAILAGSLAALGEVMRLADQNATLTEGETQAQILAASLMDELVSGARQLSAVSQAGLESDADPPWVYSVDIQNTQYEELVSVRVSVEQQLEARLQPARFELVRWMPNPNFVPADTGESDSSSSSSTSSSGASSGGGGTQP